MKSESSGDKSCEFEEDFTRCIPEELFKALNQCIECGKCVGTCTAARVSDFNSREIVQKVLEHDESVLKDESLWECFLCHYCWMICPKENMDLPALIFRLREISIEKGYAPEKLEGLTQWLDDFFKRGKIAGPNQVSEERVGNLRTLGEDSGVNVLRDHVENLPVKKKRIKEEEDAKNAKGGDAIE